LFGDLLSRRKRLRFCRLSMMAMLLCAMPLGATAETVAARHLEGTLHGYLVLKTEEGKVAAVGDLLQSVVGDRVTSHTVFHFKDGSLDDETAVFTQRGVFRLISDHHIQKGPFFAHPSDVLVDTRSGEVTVKSTGKNGSEETKTEHMKLPPDLYNGLIVSIAKNFPANTQEMDVSMVVATPRPRLIKLAISPKGEDSFSLAGVERKALHYEIKIQLGGAAGVVAPLIGKQPPNVEIWIEGGQIPGFVAEQGQSAEDGPITSIQQTGPTMPSPAHASEPHTGNGN
jgi:hypothetical protein